MFVLDNIFHVEYELIGQSLHQAANDNVDLEDTEAGKNSPTNARESSEEAFFSSLEKRYQSEVLARLKPNKPRTDVIVRYYTHPLDGEKVYILKSLGFYIHERPVDPEMIKYRSNSIFYGDSVKTDDILLVAYTLLREGMPIRNIAPSKFHDNWKAHSIEIGTDTTMREKPVLTLDELMSFSF